MATGVVTDIKDRTVTTRFGAKKAYDVYIDGKKYGNGFSVPRASVGDTVNFTTVTNGAYENLNSLEVVTAVVGGPAAATRVASNKGAFPIAPLDGQRAIVRQNALLHASKLVCDSHGGKPFAVSTELVDVIINVARQFEGYACGDTDAASAAKELAKE